MENNIYYLLYNDCPEAAEVREYYSATYKTVKNLILVLTALITLCALVVFFIFAFSGEGGMSASAVAFLLILLGVDGVLALGGILWLKHFKINMISKIAIINNTYRASSFAMLNLWYSSDKTKNSPPPGVPSPHN